MSFNFLASWKTKPTAAIKIVVLINWPHYPIALLLPGYLCNCLHTLYVSILWVYTVRTHNTFISFLFFHFSLFILSSSSSPRFFIFSYFNLRTPTWWYQSTKNTNKSQPYADISDDIVLMCLFLFLKVLLPSNKSHMVSTKMMSFTLLTCREIAW